MKKFFTLFLALVVLSSSFASVVEPVKKASEVMIPIGSSGYKISLQDLSEISLKDFETISGRHLKLADKIGFKVAQRELRKSINADGSFNNKKIEKLFKKPADGTSGFHLGGFALGFLLTIIGVLIAYLINDDKKSNRIKWAWIGLGAAVVISLLAFGL